MQKTKSKHFLSLALSIVLVGCAHMKPQNQYEQFSEIPEKTEWQIVFLNDFNPDNIGAYISTSGQPKRLRDYSVTAMKNDEFEQFYLSHVPSCEGAGQLLSVRGKVGFMVLQGACTDLISLNGREFEATSFETLIRRKLFESLSEKGAVWHLNGESLKLISTKNVTLGEFLRTK